MTAKKLIEETLPLPEINAASDTDKRTHDGHILHDAHLVGPGGHCRWPEPWPPRRSIDSGEDAAEAESQIAQAMATKALSQNQAISWLRKRVRNGEAGPAEGLGLLRWRRRHSIGGAAPRLRHNGRLDLNPVAHLIELGCLDFPQRYRSENELGRNSLVADVWRWADWVSERTRSAVDHLYPRAEGRSDPSPYYFWVRTDAEPGPQRCR